jgi:predicted ribosomally synthesized peptide with SipW-like signal peptide
MERSEDGQERPISTPWGHGHRIIRRPVPFVAVSDVFGGSMTEPSYFVMQQPEARRRRVPRWAWLAMGALLVAGTGAGTLASFSASTTNSASFATGTLVLTNSVNSGATCYSAGTTPTNITNTDTNANSCASFFNLTTKKPGDIATADLDLRNDGSINATGLVAFPTSTCSTTNGAGSYHGTGDMCTSLQITVQEYASATNRTNGTATGGGYCWFGGNLGLDNACTFGSTLGTFGSTYTSGSPLSLNSFPNQATRYFRISVQFPSSAGNNMQGLTTTNGITWRVVQ